MLIDAASAVENMLSFFKNFNIDLPYDSAVLLLGIYTEDSIITRRDACTPTFSSTLFTIVDIGKQSKNPLID